MFFGITASSYYAERYLAALPELSNSSQVGATGAVVQMPPAGVRSPDEDQKKNKQLQVIGPVVPGRVRP